MADSDPSRKPSARIERSTAEMVAAVGPNRFRNSAGVMWWSNSAEPGVDTSVANWSRAEGERGLSAIPSCIVCEGERLPRSREPSGTRGAAPMRLNNCGCSAALAEGAVTSAASTSEAVAPAHATARLSPDNLSPARA